MYAVKGIALSIGWIVTFLMLCFLFVRRVKYLDRTLWLKLTTVPIMSPRGGASFGNEYLFLWLIKMPEKLKGDRALLAIRLGFPASVIAWSVLAGRVIP